MSWTKTPKMKFKPGDEAIYAQAEFSFTDTSELLGKIVTIVSCHEINGHYDVTNSTGSLFKDVPEHCLEYATGAS
jgi:predicted Zn-dependent protease with MMP-like domain